MDVDVRALGRQRFGVRGVVLGERRRLAVREVGDLGRDAVDALALEWPARDAHDRVVGVRLLDAVAVLHPARDGLAAVRRAHALGEQPAGHLDDADRLVRLHLRLERLEREEAALRVLAPAAHVAAHEEHAVDEPVALGVGVERDAQQRAQQRAHRRHARGSAPTRAAGTARQRASSVLRSGASGAYAAAASAASGVSAAARRRVVVGAAVDALERGDARRRAAARRGRVVPRDLEDGRVDRVEARLEEARAGDDLVDAVVVVPREHDGEVELAARAVVVGHIRVLQRQHEVARGLGALKAFLERAQRRPRARDRRAAARARRRDGAVP